MLQRVRAGGVPVGCDILFQPHTPPKRPAEKFATRFIATSFGGVPHSLFVTVRGVTQSNAL